MAKDKAFSTNAETKRNEEFQSVLDMKYQIKDIVKELLFSETKKAFEELGIEKRSKPAGVYASGEGYGFGTKEDEFNITVQNKTFTSYTKETVYGGKRLISDINVAYEGNLLMVQYKTTEAGIFRGIEKKDGQSYTFHKKFILKGNQIQKVQKTLKDIFYDIAKKEVEFLINTRLGVQDKMETGTQSTVNENTNQFDMKKLTIRELFSDEDMGLSESKKTHGKNDDNEVEKNIDQVIDKNTPPLPAKNKKDKGDKRTMLFDKTKKGEKVVDELTSSVGGPGPAGEYTYKTNKILKKSVEETAYGKGKNYSRPKIDKDYNVVPQKNDSFYTKVELEPNSGYVPKGMKQNFIQGMHNATPEQLSKHGYSEGQFGINESEGKKLDLTKKKIFSESENKEKGINKRYLITEKTSEEYEKERWKKLSQFKTFESIHEAEEIIKPEDYDKIPQSQKPINETVYFEKDMIAENSIENLSEEYVEVEKPSSMFGTTYKFYKKDFINESKRYILDLNTMTFVLNPNLL